METKVIQDKIRKEASVVLWRILLFIVYYIFMIVLGLGLLTGAVWAAYYLVKLLVLNGGLNFQLRLFLSFLCVVMLWFFIRIAWHLIKPLFTFHSHLFQGMEEVVEKDEPQLFHMIREVAGKTGNKMPKHVFLTTDVNASVFYNSAGFWTLFLPTPKNLIIGLGLLQGMNKDEVKAVLTHEFGHFSQQTLKVGSICYRLLTIIREMIGQAQEQQKDAALSSLSDDPWISLFHLASGPVAWITKMTTKFYTDIEKRNRSLSRFQEFEADALACKIIGAKPYISALCKLDTLAQRNQFYDEVTAQLIKQKEWIKDYWKGYEVVDSIMADEEPLRITPQVILQEEIGDNTRFPSKVKVIDGWNTHPSIKERIDNARQFLVKNDKDIDKSPAATIVSENTRNKVGMRRLQLIAENLTEPVSWSELTEVSVEDFQRWYEEMNEKYNIPYFLNAFVQRKIVGFELPEDQDVPQQTESPLNEDNRELLLQLQQALEDMNTLQQIKSDETGHTHFLYDGKSSTNIEESISQQHEYLISLMKDVQQLDICIYNYLWHRAKNKFNLRSEYWALIFANEGLTDIESLANHVYSIRQQYAFYRSHGKSPEMNKEVVIDLTAQFWKHLQTYDFQRVFAYCGHWVIAEGRTVENMLDECYEFASKDRPTDFPNLLNIIGEVTNLYNYLYNFGKERWTRRMINAYRNIEETEEPEAELVRAMPSVRRLGEANGQ